MIFPPALAILAASGAIFLVVAVAGPAWARWLVRHGFTKKLRTKTSDGVPAPIVSKIQHEAPPTPTAGGILPLGVAGIAVLAAALIFPAIREVFFDEIAFPLAVVAAYFFVGILDDRSAALGKNAEIPGISMRVLFWLLLGIAVAVAGYAYFFLGVDSVVIFGQKIPLGIAAFLAIAVIDAFTVNAVRITDGVDGLMPGLAVIAFSALGAIAFDGGFVGTALFCGLSAGAIAGFLWHNAAPAIFWFRASGAAIGGALVAIAILTNSLSVLPILAAPFWLEGASSGIQLLWKKFFGRKILPVSPLHYWALHRGMSREKVVVRAWIFGGFCAIAAVILS